MKTITKKTVLRLSSHKYQGQERYWCRVRVFDEDLGKPDVTILKLSMDVDEVRFK